MCKNEEILRGGCGGGGVHVLLGAKTAISQSVVFLSCFSLWCLFMLIEMLLIRCGHMREIQSLRAYISKNFSRGGHAPGPP